MVNWAWAWAWWCYIRKNSKCFSIEYAVLCVAITRHLRRFTCSHSLLQSSNNRILNVCVERWACIFFRRRQKWHIQGSYFFFNWFWKWLCCFLCYKSCFYVIIEKIFDCGLHFYIKLRDIGHFRIKTYFSIQFFDNSN